MHCWEDLTSCPTWSCIIHYFSPGSRLSVSPIPAMISSPPPPGVLGGVAPATAAIAASTISRVLPTLTFAHPPHPFAFCARTVNLDQIPQTLQHTATPPGLGNGNVVVCVCVCVCGGGGRWACTPECLPGPELGKCPHIDVPERARHHRDLREALRDRHALSRRAEKPNKHSVVHTRRNKCDGAAYHATDGSKCSRPLTSSSGSSGGGLLGSAER